MLGPFRWVEREMCGDLDESLARLRSVPCLELDRRDDGSVRRHYFVESIAFGDMVWRLQAALLRRSPLSKDVL
jgi:hypothetical protein